MQGRRHPTPIVETNSLASVSPPDQVYQPHLPHRTITSGALSSAQVEAVVYACQQHQSLLVSQCWTM